MLSLDPVFYELVERDPKNWNLRKVQILDAAITQMAEKGITDMSYDSLAKALGIGRSHIVYYFADKEVLFAEVIRFVAATAQRLTEESVAKQLADSYGLAVAKRATVRSRILVTAVVDGAFDWAERFPLQVRIMALFYYFSSMRPKYRKQHTEVRTVGRKRLASAIGSESVARAIQALITGYLVEFVSLDEVDLAKQRSECHKAVSRLLAG